MNPSEIARYRTALKRYNFSRPVKTALNDGLIDSNNDFFDYGCGLGDDIINLEKIGIQCAGWDPNFRPNFSKQLADIVNLGYVINVIEDQSERAETLKDAWHLAKNLLIVSAQLYIDAKTAKYAPYKDGYLTKLGTFQKYFEQHELRQWIGEVLGESAVPAAPGIFYVFRDGEAKEAFISSRYRREASVTRLRKADELFERNRSALQPLIDFFSARGRLPDLSELHDQQQLANVFGSVRKAFRVISFVTDASQWEKIRADRSQDLLVYLALSKFDGRKKLSDLPKSLQLDVKAFFSTYKRACELADDLLFGCGNQEAIDAACTESPVGKLTPTALYVHETALAELDPLLRAYEGCARSYVGMVEGGNIVKLHRQKPMLSYLSYPDFVRNPHPKLAFSLSVNLQTFKIKTYHYENSDNPPILHRKELFMAADHNLHERFARLTRSEERAGLYENSSTIGRLKEWVDLLKKKSVFIRGHQLLRR